MQSRRIRSDARANIKYVIALTAFVLVFVVGLLLGSWWNKTEVIQQQNGLISYEYLNSLLSQIKSEYITELDYNDELTYGAAKGIVEALGDEYSSFLDPTEANAYFQSNGSSYVGIGISLGEEDEFVNVLSVMDGSPAESAGLQISDIFLNVDDIDVVGMNAQEVATLIRGAEGTEVKLNVFRPERNEEKEISVVRKEIDLDNIEFEELADGVVKINIRKFTEGAEGELSGAEAFIKQWDGIVNQVAAINPKGLVVDLRNNPGGFLSGVKYVAEEFLPTGNIIYRERERDVPEVIVRDSRTGKFENIPVVILVNEGSASAAEILAGALQDNDRAVIVGRETVGKGVEQKLITLSDGSVLLLVFRAWLTPNGTQVDADNPINPTVLIENDIEREGDEQLQAGLERLFSSK